MSSCFRTNIASVRSKRLHFNYTCAKENRFLRFHGIIFEGRYRPREGVGPRATPSPRFESRPRDFSLSSRGTSATNGLSARSKVGNCRERRRDSRDMSRPGKLSRSVLDDTLHCGASLCPIPRPFRIGINYDVVIKESRTFTRRSSRGTRRSRRLLKFIAPHRFFFPFAPPSQPPPPLPRSSQASFISRLLFRATYLPADLIGGIRKTWRMRGGARKVTGFVFLGGNLSQADGTGKNVGRSRAPIAPVQFSWK